MKSEKEQQWRSRQKESEKREREIGSKGGGNGIKGRGLRLGGGTVHDPCCIRSRTPFGMGAGCGTIDGSFQSPSTQRGNSRLASPGVSLRADNGSIGGVAIRCHSAHSCRRQGQSGRGVRRSRGSETAAGDAERARELCSALFQARRARLWLIETDRGTGHWRRGKGGERSVGDATSQALWEMIYGRFWRRNSRTAKLDGGERSRRAAVSDRVLWRPERAH